MDGAKPLALGATALVAVVGLLVSSPGDAGSSGASASPDVRLAGPGPALPAPPISEGTAPPCGAADLDVAVEAVERAMGDGLARVRAVNRTARACTLAGTSPLTLDQDGPLALVLEHRSDLPPTGDVPAEVRLEPRASAVAQLAWPGHGAAADTATPQTLGVGMADGSVVTALPGPPGLEAPFDVVDGATMTVGPWQPVGYGPSLTDEPPLEPGTWDACPAEDLVATVDGPHSSSGSGARDEEEPTGLVWLTHIGLRPCTVPHAFSLQRESGGSVAARLDHLEPGQAAALRPGDAVGARLPWSAVEPVLAAPAQWSARVGRTGGGVPFVVDGGPAA